ncbi:MAG: hypothetical protein HC913_03885 [Microscillaceae bacterium]|nr:hypothetical protein [Microscillaceae bacterium]
MATILNPLNFTKLYENQNLRISFDPDLRLFRHTWNNRNQAFTDNDALFREYALLVQRYHISTQPLYVIVDTQHLEYVMAVEMHNWMGEVVNKAMREGNTKKLAYLSSPDVFAQTSLELMTEEFKMPYYEVSFFETETEALDWLLA